MGTWLFEPGHTAAMFRARHMMVTYVRGHFKNVSGSLAGIVLIIRETGGKCGTSTVRTP